MLLTRAKSLTILPLLFTLTFGASDIGEKSSTYIDETRVGAGMEQHDSAKGRLKEDEMGQIDDTLMDVVVYNDIVRGESHHKTRPLVQKEARGKTQGIALASPASELAKDSLENEKAYKAEQERLALEKAEKDKEIPSYFAGGYCTVNTPVKIIRSSEFTILNCMLDFGNGEFRDAQVFAGVYPNYRKETLTMLPIYATFNNQNRVNLSGVVLTADKGSLNVADHVENFKIRELVAEYGLAINDVAYNYATAYMSQLVASQTTTSTDYVTVSDPNNPNNTSPIVPVTTTNTLPPRASDYFTMAGINLLSQIFAIGAKNLLEDNEPLFRIYGGKRVYVEGIVTVDNKGLAQKFGKIAQDEQSNIQKENSDWTAEKRSLYQKYDTSRKSAEQGANILMQSATSTNTGYSR